MLRIEEFTRALFGLLTILLSSLMRKSRGIMRAFGRFTRVLRGLLAEISRRVFSARVSARLRARKIFTARLAPGDPTCFVSRLKFDAAIKSS
jgi:hypothetical protein